MTAPDEGHPATGRPRVRLIHHTFRRGGGMERYAITLAGTLRALGHDVVVHARRTDAALARELDVRLETVRAGGFPRMVRNLRFFLKAERIRRREDGLHIALTRVRSKDLVVCGGTHRGYLAAMRRPWSPGDWLQVWMEREAYRSARTVVSHSGLCAGELVRLYGVPAGKIVTLFPPVDGEFAPAPGAEERLAHRRRFGLPEDAVVFLFPSTGHRRKGLYPICEALAGVPGRFVVAVVGHAPRGKPWPFLRYLGYVQDMPAAYQAADYTLLGSYYEPFGLVGVESIRCGTPLVFEERVGCLEAVQPEAVLTFAVRDPASIRRAVAAAVDRVQRGPQRPARPEAALRYDPSPREHVRLLLEAAAR
jgi:glycosyltransferase involved in cell wall biosynthesis